MKIISLYLASISILFFSSGSTTDFDYELRKIAREFRESITEDPCEVKRDIMYLIDDIEEALDDDEEYDASELRILKETLKKAEALDEYIAATDGSGN